MEVRAARRVGELTVTYHADTQEFECNGCGLREPEPSTALFTNQGEYRKPSPLITWWHLSEMRANRHLLHFCGLRCIGLYLDELVHPQPVPPEPVPEHEQEAML